jgi:PAS domain-containing protein
MTALTEQESKWVDDLAGRLRLIQAGAATAPVEKRREYLQEEVARQFATVPPGNRKRFLTALVARFPVGGRVPAAAVAPVAPPAPKPAPETPEQILDRLLAASKNVPEERRAKLAQMLAEQGLVWLDRDSLVLEVSEEARKKLGLPEGQQLRLTRLVELALVLTDTLAKLDQRALATLRELSPKSPLFQQPHLFRTAAAQYLTSDSETLDPHVQAITKLLGAFLAAALAGGKEFGKQHWGQFSPGAIEDVVRLEGGKGTFFGPNLKERCWDRYAELAALYAAPEVMDRQIKDCQARFIDKIFAKAAND